jgi:hypothetical protein
MSCVEATDCAESETCCTPVSSFLSGDRKGICVASASSCTGISRQCNKAADCEAGWACCVGKSDLGDANASVFDGDAPNTWAVIYTFSANCQFSCMPGQPQLCASDTECQGGSTCQSKTFDGLDGGVAGDFMECVSLQLEAGLPNEGGGASEAGDQSSEAGASGDAP